MRLPALFAVALAVAASAAAASSDSPAITPWHKIGDVSIGMLRGAVTYRYGQSDYPATGNAYASANYKVPGGRLDVEYRFNHVFEVGTNSARYKTPDGLGVGSKIPLPPCRTVNGQCVRVWEGFTLRHEQSRTVWRRASTYGGRQLMVELEMGTFVDGQWKHIDTVTGIAIWQTKFS